MRYVTLSVPAIACLLSGLVLGQATVNESLETAFLWVDSVHGNDANPGTQQSPLRTIGAAATIALSNNKQSVGTHVTINPGTYPETITLIGQPNSTAWPMTFQAAATGTVIVSGAVRYTNWTVYSGNSNMYTSTWANRWGFCAVDGGNAPLEQPIVLRRELVFIGGVSMNQVMTLSQMLFPGTFFVDETRGLIYVWPPAGTNMNTAEVEVGTNSPIMTISNLNGVVLRGVTFSYANSCHTGPAVLVSGNASNIVFDSDSFFWNGGRGLTFTNANNVTVMNSTANHNGGAGFNAVQVKRYLWKNVAASYNNWRGAQGAYYSWGSAGAHLFSNHDETISGFKSTYNQTFGIHWDTDTENVAATDLFLSRNMLAAEDEKGQGPLSITNSKFCNSGKYGFVLRDSELVTLTGNTFYNNAFAQLFLTGVLGGIPITNWETGQVYNLITRGLTLTNNTIAGIEASQRVFADGLLGGGDWALFQTTLDSQHNKWWNASDNSAFSVPVPQPSTQLDFAGWQDATGQDAASSFSAPAVDLGAACAVTADAPDWWLTVDNGLVSTDPAGNAVFNLLNTALGGWTGTVALALDGVTAISGATAHFSATTIPFGGTSVLTLNAGRSTPAGTYAFTVLANSGNVTRSVALSATVPLTSVRLSVSSLTFSNQPVGTTSTAQRITMTNTGASTLEVRSIAASFNAFAETNSCGSSLAPGANCIISVTFSPKNLLPAPGKLTITDTDGTSPQIVTLNGTSIGSAKGTVSPAFLYFGNQVFMKPGAVQTTRLTNAGTAVLTVGSISFTGTNAADFSATNSCSVALEVNGSCTIGVTFTPRSTGSRLADLSISSNALNTPETVKLTGNGTTALSLSPRPVGFGSITVGKPSPTHIVTITNLSTAVLAMSPLTITGPNSGDFSKTTTCVATLAGSSSCTATLTMTPQAVGPRSATLMVSGSGPSIPPGLALTGSGK